MGGTYKKANVFKRKRIGTDGEFKSYTKHRSQVYSFSTKERRKAGKGLVSNVEINSKHM